MPYVKVEMFPCHNCRNMYPQTEYFNPMNSCIYCIIHSHTSKEQVAQSLVSMAAVSAEGIVTEGKDIYQAFRGVLAILTVGEPIKTIPNDHEDEINGTLGVYMNREAWTQVIDSYEKLFDLMSDGFDQFIEGMTGYCKEPGDVEYKKSARDRYTMMIKLQRGLLKKL